jgi:hypothetical protein
MPYETEITGQWIISEDRVIADATCQRIADLIAGYLVEIGKDPSGWNTLSRDQFDGRFWELIYPRSEMHGGGPPQLRCIPKTM